MFDINLFNKTNLRNFSEVMVTQKRSGILGLTVFVKNIFDKI